MISFLMELFWILLTIIVSKYVFLFANYVRPDCSYHLILLPMIQNCTMPEPLVFYFTIQLLTMVHQLHECSILHADIKADNIMLQGIPVLPNDNWTADDVIGLEKPSLKLIDFGRSLDLTLFPERSCFLHCFQDDKCPEMRDNKPWNFQVHIIEL